MTAYPPTKKAKWCAKCKKLVAVIKITENCIECGAETIEL